MKKRMICLVLAACLIGTLTGCGKKKEEPKPEEPVVQTENEVKRKNRSPNQKSQKRKNLKILSQRAKLRVILPENGLMRSLQRRDHLPL